MEAGIKEYKTSDWKLWTFQPTPGDFVLGESVLGGTDVLGATAGSMAILDASITSLVIEDGGQVSEGIFTRPTPSTVYANLLVKDFQMSDSWKYSYGSPIWVTLANPETYDAQTYGKNTPLFFGKIRSFNVSVQPDADFSSLSITATSLSADDLNQLIQVTKDTTTDKSVLVNEAAQGQKSIVSVIPNTGFNYAEIRSETKTYAEWLDDILTCNQFVAGDENKMWGYSGTVTAPVYNYRQYISVSRNIVYPNTGVVFESENVLDVQFDWSGQDAPTSVNLTNAFDSSIEYQLVGDNPLDQNTINYSATVDVKGIEQMQTIAKKMLSMNQRFTATEVTIIGGINNQEIEFAELIGSWTFYLYPKNLINLGEAVRVYLPDLGMNTSSFNVGNITSIITGRTIEVNPDNFTITYKLWKGFDY